MFNNFTRFYARNKLNNQYLLLVLTSIDFRFNA